MLAVFLYMELWKPILDFERYEVSSLGRIRNIETGRDIKSRNREGYRAVGLSKDGKKKSFNIHRLVAQAFIPNPNNSPAVNHIDGNRANNHVSNLEWCSIKENNYHTFTNLYSKFLVIIDKETGEIVETIDLNKYDYKSVYLRK